MDANVASHYAGPGDLAAAIAASLEAGGKDLTAVTTADLASVDEFHIGGREATLALAAGMEIGADSEVLDIGCGLGGPARTIAEAHGCRVVGVDLTPEFCDAAGELSQWTGLDRVTSFRVGDATALPFEDDTFDAAVTIHAAMNIADKAGVYREAHRVVRPGGVFAIYDVLQGEGGDVLFPVPWARDPSISHLATPQEMRTMLEQAGFDVFAERDSTEDSLEWYRALTARRTHDDAPPVTFGVFLGDDFPAMAKNQIANLADRRIRTVTYFCRA